MPSPNRDPQGSSGGRDANNRQSGRDPTRASLGHDAPSGPPGSDPICEPPSRDAPPLLRLSGIQKAFPGVLACDRASLEVSSGEIHALVGENGAGKSTLIKVITGAHRPDAGRIDLVGRAVTFGDPLAAVHAGIATIYQELNLVPALSVRDNLFLGRRSGRGGIVPKERERRLARDILRRLDVDIDPETPCGKLDIARQQLVEIARALLAGPRLLIMDEPTATLTEREVDALFAILGSLRDQGTGILFISHRLDEVFGMADRVTVMRDGATLGTWPTAALSRQRLIELMVGRPMDQEFPKVRARAGQPRLEVRGLRGGDVKEVSLTARRGEVVGLAGLVGAGRTALARLIFGADPKQAGDIFLDGRRIAIDTPRDAIRHGICLLTEDRKAQGLIPCLSARENFALPNLAHWARHGWIDGPREDEAFTDYRRKFRIRLKDARQPAGQLSGGNQQKLLLARWMESESRVVILDEPTRGIDVGSKHEIYQLMNQLAAQGKALIMISSELPEIIGMSDRILVMHEGRITGEIADTTTATQARILQMAVS